METTEKHGVIPFLSFTGNAEEAMTFYAEVLPNATMEVKARYEKGMPMGEEGKVLMGTVNWGGGQIMFLDMDSKYPAPPFSWATSLFINCCDEAMFDEVFAGLSQGGTVMMGPESVGHIRKCAWVTDKFGVTWQPVWEQSSLDQSKRKQPVSRVMACGIQAVYINSFSGNNHRLCQ